MNRQYTLPKFFAVAVGKPVIAKFADVRSRGSAYLLACQLSLCLRFPDTLGVLKRVFLSDLLCYWYDTLY